MLGKSFRQGAVRFMPRETMSLPNTLVSSAFGVALDAPDNSVLLFAMAGNLAYGGTSTAAAACIAAEALPRSGIDPEQNPARRPMARTHQKE